MSDSLTRLSCIIFIISICITLSSYLNWVQAAEPLHCVTLEHSSLSKHSAEIESGLHASALSHDQQYIALYQYVEKKNLATFKLWNSQTGQLLKTAQLRNFEERSRQIQLRFSPNDTIVYLQGMTYHTHSTTTGAIPFWHLADNRLIMSPCATAMGLAGVTFSTDNTVAYSRTVDGFHSLCGTQKAEQLAALWYTHHPVMFDPQKKHLSVQITMQDGNAYQQLLQNIKKGRDTYISIDPSPIQKKQILPSSHATNVTTRLKTIDQSGHAWLTTQNSDAPILHLLDYHQKQQNLYFCSFNVGSY